MADETTYTPLPADLPEDWTIDQTIAPTGADVGLSQQHGYNYLMQQVNNTQRAVNEQQEQLGEKQDTITGVEGQVVGFDGDGNAIPQTGVGRAMAGQTVEPTSGETVTAGDGAEVFNDYRPREFSSAGTAARGNVASGQFSHAEGIGTTASGYCSHAEGVRTTASGYYSHAEGSGTTASGDYSHAEGIGTTASGKNSHAEGFGTIASYSSNGATDSGTSHAEGRRTTASGDYSHAEGSGTTASGDYSHAEGIGTTASGYYSHAEGNNTTAINTCAHAEGSGASAQGQYSHAEGSLTVAKGSISHAGGHNTIANDYQTVVGTANVENTTSTSTSGARFIVGGGWSTRKNAFRVDANGSCYGTGAWNTSGADYAELFEWADENLGKEDRAGLFVTLDGERIRIATPEDDYIIGVVSACPSVVGDVYDDQWAGMYLRDVFGRTVMEEQDFPAQLGPDGEEIIPAFRALAPKVNPDYDQTVKYQPRTQRPEWDAVGMMGKLVAVDDGTCQVNGWATVGEGGKATHSKARTKYRVMARLDDTHIKLLIL